MTDEKPPRHLRAVANGELDDDPPEHELPAAQPGFDQMRPPTGEEIIETMTHGLMVQLQPALIFAPEFPRERLPEVARFIAEEQYKINTEVLPRMADPDEPHPRIALKFTTMPTGPSDVATPREGVVFESVRRLEGIFDPEDASRMAFIYAFFDSPVARAILRMNHYTYQFSFVGEAPPRVLL